MEKRNKSKFLAKCVGIKVTIFQYKSISQETHEIFGTQCFLADSLKHKTINKITCRMASA